MSATTGIEWTDATWNPVVGCEKVSQGCKFCYAKTVHDRRHAAYLAGKKVAEQYRLPFESVQLKPERLTYPISWGTPRKIFVTSVSDPFHHDVPDTFLDQVMAIIAFTRRHSHQLLTKRPERARDYFVEMTSGSGASKDRWDAARLWLRDALPYKPGPMRERMREQIGIMMADTWLRPIPNLWLGTSVENQKAANERIPHLLQTPGVGVRWISAEPLLGPIDFVNASEAFDDDIAPTLFTRLARAGNPSIRGLDWVVVGGESGTRKQDVRPMHPEWAREIRDQCVAAGVPFLFKQWGEYVNIDPPGSHSAKVGTKRAGRQLDGRTWDEYPTAAVQS